MPGMSLQLLHNAHDCSARPDTGLSFTNTYKPNDVATCVMRRLMQLQILRSGRESGECVWLRREGVEPLQERRFMPASQVQ